MWRIRPLAKQRARKLRREMTDAEQRLWGILRDRQLGGYRFRRQHPLGHFILDFVCLEARLIIEVDGSQHLEQRERDEQRTVWLEGQGFRVLRFWDNDVLKETEAVKEALWQVLCSGASPTSQPSP